MAISARISVAAPAPPTTAELQGMALAVLASSPDCIKILSADGFIEYLSEGGRTALELDCSGEDLIGTHWPNFWLEEDRPSVERAMRRALRGEMARFTAFCATRRGTPKCWDVTVSPFRSEQAGQTKLLVVSRDVTSSQMAASALLARAARQELLYRLAAQLLNATDEAQLLRTVVAVAPPDLGMDMCMAYAADRGAQMLFIRHWHGIDGETAAALR